MRLNKHLQGGNTMYCLNETVDVKGCTYKINERLVKGFK